MPTDKPARHADRSGTAADRQTPRSPAELDARILQQARLKAGEYERYAESTGFRWFGDGWKTAVGGFSVVVIAIAVTVQVVDRSQPVEFSSSQEAAMEQEAASAAPQALADVAPEPATELLQSPARLSEERRQAATPPAADNSQPATAARGIEVQQRAVSTEPAAAAAVADTTGFAQSVTPDLQSLLDSLETTTTTGRATGNLAESSTTPLLTTLNNELARLTQALNEAGISLPAVPSVQSPAGPDQEISSPGFQATITTLVSAYRSASPAQQSDAGSAFRTGSAGDPNRESPANLEATITVLENWLADQ